MRVVAAPDFPSKLGTLIPEQLGHLGSAMHTFGAAADQAALLGRLGPMVMGLAGDNLYATRLGNNGRLIFSFGQDQEGPYVLLLDVIALVDEKGRAPAVPVQIGLRNPKTNPSLNPAVNRTLDPRINRTLDPRINRSIDPSINRSLDPTINRTLDPRINRSLDPRINRSLDPSINRSLDPRINRTLDPSINRAFGGPFVYDLRLQNVGFLIRANPTAFLVFDTKGSYVGYAHQANASFALRFSRDGDWIEYWVVANNDVWLRFSVGGEWKGQVVMD
jgi:hypothetical protein